MVVELNQHPFVVKFLNHLIHNNESFEFRSGDRFALKSAVDDLIVGRLCVVTNSWHPDDENIVQVAFNMCDDVQYAWVNVKTLHPLS